MNKHKFIEKIKETLKLDDDQANIVNNILENNNIIGKKSKEKIINDLMVQLKIDNEKANYIYETTMNIITTAIKNKIKHPFKSID